MIYVISYHIYHIHQYVKKMKYPHELSVSLGKHVGLVKLLWEPARCAGCFSVMALVSSGAMVSSTGLAWWFGARWFGFLGSPYERDCYSGVSLESQTTNPNHQLTISWWLEIYKKNCQFISFRLTVVVGGLGVPYQPRFLFVGLQFLQHICCYSSSFGYGDNHRRKEHGKKQQMFCITL